MSMDLSRFPLLNSVSKLAPMVIRVVCGVSANREERILSVEPFPYEAKAQIP